MKSLLRTCLFLAFLCQPLLAGIIHIPADYRRIQDALHNAAANDTLLLSPGVYAEDILIQSQILTIAGTWIIDGDSSSIEETRIIGDTTRETRRPLMIRGAYQQPFDVRLMGLTVANGYQPSQAGGGIWARQGNLEMDHVVLENNQADSGGATWFTYLDFTMRSCIVRNNSSSLVGAGINGDNGSLLVEYSRFAGNACDYGASALSWGDGNMEISNSIFESNQAGPTHAAVLVSEMFYNSLGRVLIEHCTFRNNEGGMGGALQGLWVDSLIVRSNHFLNNRAFLSALAPGAGGACYFVLSPVTILTDNLFQSNTAESQGGAVYMASDGMIEGNVFAQNRARNMSAVLVNMVNDSLFHVTFRRNLVTGNGPVEIAPFYRSVVEVGREATLIVEESDFIDNQGNACYASWGGVIEIAGNYWGAPSGPYVATSNPGGEGDTLPAELNYQPFSPVHFFAPRIGLSEVSLDFGAVPLDSTAARSLQIRNLGFEQLQVLALGVTGTGFGVEINTETFLESRDSTEIIVRFHPQSEGLAQAVLTLWTNDPSQPEVLIPFLGNGLTALHEDRETLPLRFGLSPPYPNPANSEVIFSFALPFASDVQLEVVDLLGRRVAIPYRGVLSAGHYTLPYNTSSLASGIYLLRAKLGDRPHYMEKFVLLK